MTQHVLFLRPIVFFVKNFRPPRTRARTYREGGAAPAPPAPSVGAPPTPLRVQCGAFTTLLCPHVETPLEPAHCLTNPTVAGQGPVVYWSFSISGRKVSKNSPWHAASCLSPPLLPADVSKRRQVVFSVVSAQH
jgi:hypothetical protein